jgi:hypothetical protein
VISTWRWPILLVAWSSLAAHAYLPKHKRIWLTLKKVTIVWHAKSLHVQYVTDHQNLLVKPSQYPFYVAAFVLHFEVCHSSAKYRLSMKDSPQERWLMVQTSHHQGPLVISSEIECTLRLLRNMFLHVSATT